MPARRGGSPKLPGPAGQTEYAVTFPNFPRTFVPIAVTVLILLAAPAPAADWPAYRGDIGRTGFVDAPLPTGLRKQWTHQGAAAAPAWPDPVVEYHMMAFDWAHHPVVAGGRVLYGSTSDHQVHALDLAAGKVVWRLFTGGPVRFAPSVADGKVYVASDDGVVYCVSAADGKEVWTTRVAPGDEMIFANGQMASRWPLRSGLIVDKGRVFVTAGMWPLDGVYTCILDAADGKVVKKVKAKAKFTPQGYMAGNDTTIFLPNGRTPSWTMPRATAVAGGGHGHSWAVVKGNQHYSGIGPFKANKNLAVKGVWPHQKRPNGTVVNSLVVDAKGRRAPARSLPGQLTVALADDMCYSIGRGQLNALVPGKGYGVKWRVRTGDGYEVIACKNAVVVGGKNVVTVFDRTDGKKLFSAPVDGEARGLAIADGRLIVSTHKGQITCFAAAAPPAKQTPPASRPKWDEKVVGRAGDILKATGVTEGYCLLVGADGAPLAAALAEQSKLRVYVVEADAAKVAAMRKQLADAGLYGTRVVVHHAGGKRLPHPDYFADLIVAIKGAKVAPAELGRALHPCGGVAYVGAGAGITGEALSRKRQGAVEIVTRGDLPGAGEWTHQYANAGKSASSGDTRVRWPLKVLWFGEPGPGQMMNRHLRGTAPLLAKGRLFILGQHSIIAVDAYNGRKLWSHNIAAVQRRVVDIRGGNMVTDGQSVFLASGDRCLRFAAGDGKLLQTYRLPVSRPRFTLDKPRDFAMGSAGNVRLRRTKTHLELDLTTKDAKVTNGLRTVNPVMGDSWQLFFDFRAADKRTGLYSPGAFSLVVVPATVESAVPTCTPGPFAPAPEVKVAGKTDATGSATTVRIAWADIARLTGGKSAEFLFGTILNSSDNGQRRTKRVHRFANHASYRLANVWGAFTLDGAIEAAADEKLLAVDKPVEKLIWGHLAVVGDRLVGTVVAQSETWFSLRYGQDFGSEKHDYTGPVVPHVLVILGQAQGAKHVFALDRDSGRLQWSYKADQTVPHNALAVDDKFVYLIDRPDPWSGGSHPRKAAEVPAKGRLAALDLAAGKVVWRKELPEVAHHQLRMRDGVLLTSGMRGMTAYDAIGGKQLWTMQRGVKMHHCSAYMRAPVLTGKWIYDEPHAYDLRTGKVRTVNGKPWTWGNFRGCGTVSGGENMLFFRGGNLTIVDTGDKKVRSDVIGIRPGCFINVIAAGGLALMPEAASGCGCAYSFQTTITFVPTKKK